MQRRPKRFYMILATAIALAIVAGVTSLCWYFNQNHYGPRPVRIEVTTDKPFYLQGEEVHFVIYVTNPQDWPVPHPDGEDIVIEHDGAFIHGGDLSAARLQWHICTVFRLLRHFELVVLAGC